MNLEDKIKELLANRGSNSIKSDTSVDKNEKREKILKEKIQLRENEIKQLKEENDNLKFGGEHDKDENDLIELCEKQIEKKENEINRLNNEILMLEKKLQDASIENKELE